MPKELGGLGVRDLVVKNTMMLFIWWWRFSEENIPLWKRVVCSCNRLKMDRTIWEQLDRMKGGPWANICSIWKANKEVKKVVKSGIWIAFGNGEHTLMWEDLWVSEGRLMNKVLRLYDISLQKNCTFFSYFFGMIYHGTGIFCGDVHSLSGSLQFYFICRFYYPKFLSTRRHRTNYLGDYSALEFFQSSLSALQLHLCKDNIRSHITMLKVYRTG